MARNELSSEPENRVEMVLAAGMEAMERECEKLGVTFKRAFVHMQVEPLPNDESDTGANARGDYNSDQEILLDLLMQAKVLAGAIGADMQIFPVEKMSGPNTN